MNIIFFHLPFVEVHESSNPKKLNWIMKDGVLSPDYEIPTFRTIHLSLDIKKEGKIPRYTDKIHSISIRPQQAGRGTKEGVTNESLEIQGESERPIYYANFS